MQYDPSMTSRFGSWFDTQQRFARLYLYAGLGATGLLALVALIGFTTFVLP